MTVHGHRRLFAAVIAATALVLSSCGNPAPATSSAPTPVPATAPTPTPEPDFKYVALGDSFVAGGGIATTTTACQRSDHNYPALLAKSLDVDSFVDVSCGGATTTDVLESSTPPGNKKVPAQLDAVDADTDLVTIGIGGNDSGLTAKVAYGCFFARSNAPAACRSTLTTVPALLTTTQRNVTETLKAVKARAPKARVLLVGYLRILPGSGMCPAIPVDPDLLKMAATVEADLDDTLETAAQDAGVDFISLRSMSTGHDACAGEAAWVNGVTAAEGDGILLHPRASGMEAVAKNLRSYVQAG